MIILDSNILIALFNPEDTQHAKAKKFMEKIQGTVVLPEILISEICTVLSQRLTKKAADQFIDIVKSNENIEILFLKSNFENVLTFYQDTKKEGLSFIDIYLLQLSKNFIVHTFDKKLDKAIKLYEKETH